MTRRVRHRIHGNPFNVRGEIEIPNWQEVYGRDAGYRAPVDHGQAGSREPGYTAQYDHGENQAAADQQPARNPAISGVGQRISSGDTGRTERRSIPAVVASRRSAT